MNYEQSSPGTRTPCTREAEDTHRGAAAGHQGKAREGAGEAVAAQKRHGHFHLIGLIFGRLTVISEAEKRHKQIMWNCKCDCGKEKTVSTAHLRHNRILSCGCLGLERRIASRKTHGASHTRLFKTWIGMKKRCGSPNEPSFKNYGARGILVCPRWHDFANFRADVGEPPTTAHTLERKDNNAGYEPGNCRWATRLEQGRNKTNNLRIEARGENHCASEWAEITGISVKAIYNRIRRGWIPEMAVTTPIIQRIERSPQVDQVPGNG